MKKQITVISASNANLFEKQANRALSRIEQPRLVFDKTKPYLLYIVHDAEAPINEGKQSNDRNI